MKRFWTFTTEQEAAMTFVTNQTLDSFFQTLRKETPDKYFIKEFNYMFFKRYVLFLKQYENKFMTFNFAYRTVDKAHSKVSFGILMAFFLGYEKGVYDKQ